MPLIDTILGFGRDLIARFLPNPEDELKRQQMYLEFQAKVFEKQADLQLAAAEIVKAEASSSNWLTASWRPILMLTFGVLVVARCFGVNNPSMTPAEYDHLWTLLEIGIGGYIGGRSVEKVAGLLADKSKGDRK